MAEILELPFEEVEAMVLFTIEDVAGHGRAYHFTQELEDSFN